MISFTRNSRNVLVVTAACLLVAGCVSKTNTLIVANPTINAAKPTTGAMNVNRIVVSGERTKFGSFMSLNPDCSTNTPATVRVTQQPSHGTFEVVDQTDYPTFPASNPRSACNRTKVPSQTTYYTSEPGYTGADYAEIDIFNNGGEAVHKIRITVK